MRSDDVKRMLEAAAAGPSRPLDVPGLVNAGARMRRARFAAVAAGVAIVVAGASATFGLPGLPGFRGDDRPRPASGEGICRRAIKEYPFLHMSVFLRDDATRAEIESLRDALSASPDVDDVTYLSKKDVYREFKRLYVDQPELREAIPPDALPATFRITAVGEDAIERIEATVIGAPGVDEVRSADPEAALALCESPAPDVRVVESPDDGSGPTDLVPDVDVVLSRAECSVEAHYGDVVPEGKWCRFVVRVDNDGDAALNLSVEEQLLVTSERAVSPWSQAMTGYFPSQLFKGPVPGGSSMLGEIVFLLTKEEVPLQLELQVEERDVPFAFDLSYDCVPDLHEDPRGKCLFEGAATGPNEAMRYPTFAAGDVEVELQSLTCSSDPLRRGSVVIRSYARWCGVMFRITNWRAEPIRLDPADQTVTSDSLNVYLPWDRATRAIGAARLLVESGIEPGESRTGTLFYTLPTPEVPATLVLSYEPGLPQITVPLGAGDCNSRMDGTEDFTCDYEQDG